MSEMKVIRHAREIGNQTEKKWVIWGAGNLGCGFLQEVRINGIKNVYIYDTNDANTKDLLERILLSEIISEIKEISFIIAVQKKQMVDEIVEQISLYEEKNNQCDIYRYIPEDHAFLIKKLREEGFYNGIERKKAIGDLYAKKLIEQKIQSGKAFLLSRWGGIEGEVVYADRAGVLTPSKVSMLKSNAGVYPLDKASIHRFADYCVNAAKAIDILIAGCWCSRVEELYRLYSPDSILVTSSMMYPFWSDISWTRALEGKKVIVIHPFAELFGKQYLQRSKLFDSPDILIQMDLITYKAVQSMNGSSEFASWFDAFDKMKEDIGKLDFDIALLGCGAYGMPLGAFIKNELSKQAIHIGGTLQLLFGIKGKRWEGNGYDYENKLYNEYWIRPTDDLKPQNYKDVENGCYW